VNSLPTLFGEKLVLRCLDALPATLSLDSLGLAPAQRDTLEAAISAPHGLVLVTGPTGSGKTLLLYCFLQMLNAESRNLCSVEDPAEIQLAGINQVSVREKAGLTFAVALRAFLRQDPDVIMVGESVMKKPLTSRSRQRKPATWCSPHFTPTTRPPPSRA
jgi:type IV pilus assembly protein PilB